MGIPEKNVFLFSQLFITIEQQRYLPTDLTRNISLSLLLIGKQNCSLKIKRGRRQYHSFDQNVALITIPRTGLFSASLRMLLLSFLTSYLHYLWFSGFVVFVFFANFRMSLICSFTVFLSLVDVFGMIHYYGLTLEPVTAMTMTILIGLGVDFSIHVG